MPGQGSERAASAGWLRRWASALALWGCAFGALLVHTWAAPDPVQWDEDEIRYYELAAGWADLVQHGDTGAAVEAWHSVRPPLYLMWLGLVLALLGRDPLVAVSAQGLALLVLYLFTYDLARRLRNARAALLATAVLLCSPLLVTLSRTLMMALPLAAVVMAAAWLVWVRRPLARRWGCLELGALAGAGLLIKWTFPLYVGPVVLVAIARELSASSAIAKRRLVITNAAYAAGLAALLALPYYASVFGMLTGWLHQVSLGQEAALYGAGARSSLQEAMFYPLGLVNLGLTLPLTLVLLPGLVRFARRGETWTRWLLLTSLAAPVLAYSLILNKQLRFLAPCLPFLALACGLGLDALASPRLRRGLTGLALALCLLDLVSVTAARPDYPPREQLRRHGPLVLSWSDGVQPWWLATRAALDTPLGELALVSRIDPGYPAHGRIPPGYRSQAIAARLDALLRDRPGARVVVLPWELEVWGGLWHLARRQDLGFEVQTAVCHPHRVAGAEVVLAMQPMTPVWICDEQEGVREFAAVQEQYRVLEEYALPGGRTLTLWVREDLLD